MRETGPTREVRELVMRRARMRCQKCGKNLASGGGDIHHRRPRGMGGTHDTTVNLPENLMLLCRDCHRWVEENRLEAKRRGYLLNRRDTNANGSTAN